MAPGGAPPGGRRRREGVAPGVAPGARVSPQAEAAAETLLGRGLLGLQRLHLPQQRRGLQVHDVRREEGHLHTVGRRRRLKGKRGRGGWSLGGLPGSEGGGCDRNRGREEPLGGFPAPRGAKEGGRDRNRVTFTGGSPLNAPRAGSAAPACVCGERSNKYQEGRNCLHSLTPERPCPSHQEEPSPGACLITHHLMFSYFIFFPLN